jgi:hypothetical protein
LLLTHKLTRLLTSVLSIVLVTSLFALPATAKSKKGKSAASRSKGSATKQARSGKSSRRQVARRGKRGRSRITADNSANINEFAGNHPIVPDRVEVLEYGSTNPGELSRWLNPAQPSSQMSANDGTVPVVTSTRSRKVNIDSERVIQIQQALAKRGLYSGETTGIYDEATIDAMRRFQINSKIAVTGYPTAHSLKRLGLGTW